MIYIFDRAQQKAAGYSTPYKFTSKELDDETGLYYFGARYYDPSLSIWHGVDAMSDKYPNLSPYVYCSNNPINAFDPDGNRIIFVNGYWNRVANWANAAPGSGGKSYWNYFDRSFISAARSFLGVTANETNLFIDGSSKIGFDQDGSDRWQLGYNYAKENYKALTEGLAEGETFKLVGHSEGSVWAAGISEYLIQKGHTVESILQLSPDEALDFNNPSSPDVYHIHSTIDPVSEFFAMDGSDYTFLLKNENLLSGHGATVSSQTLKAFEVYKNKIDGDKGPYYRKNIYESFYKIIKDNLYTIIKDEP